MKTKTNRELRADWSNRLAPLIGRTIKSVRWMSPTEVEKIGWYSAPIVLTLDDETLLYPSRDDEGNDAGALFIQEGTKTKGIETIAPVINATYQ